MKKLALILMVMAMPVFLAACTKTQTGASSYNGGSLKSKAVKNRASGNELFSSSNRYRAKSVNKKLGRKSAKKSSQRSSKRVSSKPNRRGLRKLIAKHARANGVPVKLAMAVVQVESSYRANARGAAGEVGLMQLMPATARMIGYKGKMRALYNPNTNLKYGMKYLGKAYRLGGRTPCGAVLKYNAGHGAKRMNPISRKYCRRVAKIMRRR